MKEKRTAAYGRILEDYGRMSRLRTLPSDSSCSGSLDLADNDYLGLAKRSGEFLDEFLGFSDMRFTSSASRLLSSRQQAYSRLEERLGELFGRSVLLFNSGYHVNTGCISSLSIPGTLFLPDKLVHASIIDGLTLGHAEFRRWRHNDTGALRKLLEKYHDSAERIIVAVESIYSMDGDTAPLRELVSLKKEYPNMILYVDEAHAFGVRGERGLGLCEETGITGDVDIIIGTFGKACASQGAFAATSDTLRNYFLNSARSFIFSTAIPPVNCEWTLLMIEKILGMKRERERLLDISRDMNEFVSELTGIPSVSESHIVPVMIGDAEKAVRIAAALRSRGITALPIRRPTVPPGTERIRLSLNAGLSEAEIYFVKKKLSEIFANEN